MKFSKMSCRIPRDTFAGHSIAFFPAVPPDPRYQGRGEFLERKMRPAVPTQAGSEGTANPYMMGLPLMHLRCTELAALMHKHCQTGELAKCVFAVEQHR